MTRVDDPVCSMDLTEDSPRPSSSMAGAGGHGGNMSVVVAVRKPQQDVKGKEEGGWGATEVAREGTRSEEHTSELQSR